ncbi:hypothetical protein [Streptomyces colonosanans]|uniref:hypothetical protein n=1 Tax=Streptomyces colonosanans TaxID=1428652 RepID=UPI0009A0FE93|nr:hypothetical protein [Streptomyces colonosanans]
MPGGIRTRNQDHHYCNNPHLGGGVWRFLQLEDQMVAWVTGMDSPDRMDAAVHALTELADPDQLATGRSPLAGNRLDGRR